MFGKAYWRSRLGEIIVNLGALCHRIDKAAELQSSRVLAIHPHKPPPSHTKQQTCWCVERRASHQWPRSEAGEPPQPLLRLVIGMMTLVPQITIVSPPKPGFDHLLGSLPSFPSRFEGV